MRTAKKTGKMWVEGKVFTCKRVRKVYCGDTETVWMKGNTMTLYGIRETSGELLHHVTFTTKALALAYAEKHGATEGKFGKLYSDGEHVADVIALTLRVE
jgi:hypothetical protein